MKESYINGEFDKVECDGLKINNKDIFENNTLNIHNISSTSNSDSNKTVSITANQDKKTDKKILVFHINQASPDDSFEKEEPNCTSIPPYCLWKLDLSSDKIWKQKILRKISGILTFKVSKRRNWYEDDTTISFPSLSQHEFEEVIEVPVSFDLNTDTDDSIIPWTGFFHGSTIKEKDVEKIFNGISNFYGNIQPYQSYPTYNDDSTWLYTRIPSKIDVSQSCPIVLSALCPINVSASICDTSPCTNYSYVLEYRLLVRLNEENYIKEWNDTHENDQIPHRNSFSYTYDVNWDWVANQIGEDKNIDLLNLNCEFRVWLKKFNYASNKMDYTGDEYTEKTVEELSIDKNIFGILYLYDYE